MKIYRDEKEVTFTFNVDILKILKYQMAMYELKKKFKKEQDRDLDGKQINAGNNYLQKHS